MHEPPWTHLPAHGCQLAVRLPSSLHSPCWFLKQSQDISSFPLVTLIADPNRQGFDWHKHYAIDAPSEINNFLLSSNSQSIIRCPNSLKTFSQLIYSNQNLSKFYTLQLIFITLKSLLFYNSPSYFIYVLCIYTYKCLVFISFVCWRNGDVCPAACPMFWICA